MDTKSGLLLVLALAIPSAYGASWNYDKRGADWCPASGSGGPFPDCCGTRQSPIDIVTANVQRDQSLGNIQFSSDYKSRGIPGQVVNNGHTLKFSAREGFDLSTFTATGGIMGGDTFQFLQFHMHWGEGNRGRKMGSEHTVNGKRYLAEIHLVHWNTKYPDVDTALGMGDGLAVIGFFIDGVSGSFKETRATEEINSLSRRARIVSGYNAMVYHKPILGNFVKGMALDKYYSYLGSLTTPTCNEAVLWTVAKEPIKMASKKMENFVKMRATPKVAFTPIIKNYRKVQPLGMRTVKKNW